MPTFGRKIRMESRLQKVDIIGLLSRHEVANQDSVSWNWIWRLKVHEKIQEHGKLYNLFKMR